MFQKVRIWFRHHRKGVIITCTILSAVGGIVLILLNNGKKIEMSIDEFAESLIPDERNEAKTISSVAHTVSEVLTEAVEEEEKISVEVDGVMKTFPRKEFIRQLHEGWNASPEKIAQAADMGIELKQGETLVNGCTVTIRNVG